MSDFSSVPDNWTSKKLAEVVNPHRRITYGIVQPGPRFTPELGVPMIRGQDYSGGEVRVDDLYYVSPRLAASFDRASVRGGDILLSIVGYVGLVAEVPEILSGANLTQTTARIAIQEELHSRFFLHFFRSKAFHSEVKKYMKGSAQPGLNLADVEKMKVIFPERREEQAAISKILDTLDTAIQETEAIIAKLKAVKQGLLHDLLTRGIDANGELRPPQSEAPNLYKPSPLGWIPKEWDIATLEAVSSTVTSGSRDWARFYAESGALFVRIGNLTREHINFRFDSTIYVCPPHNADGQRTRLEPGDILISITADLGIVGVVPDGMGEAYINQHIALVRPNIGAVNPRFVGHYLASPVAQAYISKLNDAGAKAGLNLPTIRGLLTARPEHTEQNLIAERLDEIDNRIQNATRESAKLRDLKFGLMDDLLIGRVRVTPLLQEAQQA